VFRVLVLGDSLTYGDGIDERFTYWLQVERRLRRSWRVEVVNAGISGAQSEDVVRVARRLIPEMQPDLVIYGVCLNDFLPSGVGEYDGSFHLPDLIRTRTRIGPIAELLVSNALIRLGVSKDFFDDILNGMPKYRARFARDVAELDHFVRAHEIPPVIALVLDQFPEIGGRGQHIASLAEQALAAAGMTVLDTEAYYRQFSQMSPLRVSRWEGHPNEEVNAVWALMLEQVVEQDQRLADFGIRLRPRPSVRSKGLSPSLQSRCRHFDHRTTSVSEQAWPQQIGRRLGSKGRGSRRGDDQRHCVARCSGQTYERWKLRDRFSLISCTRLPFLLPSVIRECAGLTGPFGDSQSLSRTFLMSEGREVAGRIIADRPAKGGRRPRRPDQRRGRQPGDFTRRA
jgi:lysophospholipase L1-like esterase